MPRLASMEENNKTKLGRVVFRIAEMR
jgi:hypothetical protein